MDHPTDPATDSSYVEYAPDMALGSMAELADLAIAVNAGCLSTDPDAMYPDAGDKRGNLNAKRVCHGCPIRETCGATAITHRERYGVWGGITEDERAAIKRVIRGVDPLGSHAPQDDTLFSLDPAV